MWWDRVTPQTECEDENRERVGVGGDALETEESGCDE